MFDQCTFFTCDGKRRDPSRFDDLSVLVVDYAMPEMTGIEFCAQFRGHRVKKMLLTGAEERDVVFDAFNQGIIDHFVAKNDDALVDHLADAFKMIDVKKHTAMIFQRMQEEKMEAQY